MRIAYVVSMFPSTSQTFVLNQITGVLDAGHSVDVYAWGRGGNGIIHGDVDSYNLQERTKYLKPPAGYFQRLTRMPLSLLRSGAWARPGTVLSALNCLRHGRFAASLGLFYGVAVLMRNASYDIIHCQFGSIASRLLAFREVGVAQGSLVVSFRGADVTRLNPNDRNHIMLTEQCDMALPVCEVFKKRLVGAGFVADRIRVHRSGVSLDKFQFSSGSRRVGDATKLITIGRLVEKKGISYGIRAVADLKARGHHIEYRIVGEGRLRKDLVALVRKLGLCEEVVFVGPVRSEEVGKLLQQADILVAPSVTAEDGDQEGIPNVLKEAMAVGLPVVSTYHGGIPELVESGRSGFLVPERNANILADRLEWLIHHPEIWFEMGRAGRKKVEKEYDIQKLNQQLIGIYETVLSGRRSFG